MIIREDFNVPIKIKEGKVEILDDERFWPPCRRFVGLKAKSQNHLNLALGRPESPMIIFELYPYSGLEKILKEK